MWTTNYMLLGLFSGVANAFRRIINNHVRQFFKRDV